MKDDREIDRDSAYAFGITDQIRESVKDRVARDPDKAIEDMQRWSRKGQRLLAAGKDDSLYMFACLGAMAAIESMMRERSEEQAE